MMMALSPTATANRIDQLPPELIRKGRMDEVFFVDLPETDVRLKIFDIHLNKRGLSSADFDLVALAAYATPLGARPHRLRKLACVINSASPGLKPLRH